LRVRISAEKYAIRIEKES